MLRENSYFTLVDAHVHIYDCFSLKDFFDSAFRNFALACEKIAGKTNFIGLIFLTESKNYKYFEKFFNDPDKYSKEIGYKISKTFEKDSLKICNGNNCLILIAGEQIVTKENLEVLALGTINRFKYGKSISDTIDEINKDGAIPVLPWGVGKWFGNRGRLVRDTINKYSDIFLGDNSGRPFFWSIPSLFNEGVKKNLFTLRGSDPLPLKSQEKKVGSFGFYFLSEFDFNHPAAFIKSYLSNIDKEPNNYGRLENPFRFIKNQFTIHFKQGVTK